MLAFLSLLATPAASGGLIWSDEIVLDPGVRAASMYGFKTRLAFARHEDQIVATWADTPENGREASVYVVGPSGQNDGVVRHLHNDRAVTTLQVSPALDGGWIVLEVGPNVGLCLSRVDSFTRDPIVTVLLDRIAGTETRSIRLETVEDGYWVGWQSGTGEVRLAWLEPDLELDGEIAILSDHADGIDIEFGEDGGVIGWSSIVDGGLSYVSLDPRGRPLHEPRFVADAGLASSFATARINDRIFHVRQEGARGFRIEAFAVATVETVVDVLVDGFRSDDFVLASGPTGALLMGSTLDAMLLDTDGRRMGPVHQFAERFYPGSEKDYAAIWADDHFLVGWSSLGVEVFSGESTSRSQYCFVHNWAELQTLSPERQFGPIELLNAVYEPVQGQPWFVGGDLHVLLRDANSNRLQHVRVAENGSYALEEQIGNSDPCDTWLISGPGVVSGDRLVHYRRESYSSRFGDYEFDYFRVSVLGGGSESLRTGNPQLSLHWSVAVANDEVWVVSDLTSDGSHVYGPGSLPVDLVLEPSPTRRSSQIMSLDGRPYVVWESDGALLGGFVPEEAGSTIDPVTLREVPGLLLEAAVEGGRGGLILYRSNEEGGSFWAQPILASGRTLGEPALLATGSTWGPAHGAWDRERFLIAWIEQASGGPSACQIKMARVSFLGEVFDPGGVIVATADDYGRPLVAAASPGQVAVVYAGNRLRRVIAVTPILASGPFVESTPQGIEVSWTLGAGAVSRAVIERADSPGPNEPDRFAIVHTAERQAAREPYLDGDVDRGASYLYRIRLVEGNGDEIVLGPITATWSLGTLETGAPVFSVRPNPTPGHLSLQLDPRSSVPDRIAILDVQGRLCAAVPETALRDLARLRTVDLSPWLNEQPSGTYWVRVFSGTRGATHRVQIIR